MAGAHSDYGTLTVLHIEDAPGGLQVETPGGRWIDVPAVPDAFVINLGDLMMRWTNDRWISTKHRVRCPPAEVSDRSRMSIAFFHQPNYDAVCEVIPTCLKPGEAPRYPAITSGQHWLDKTLKAKAPGAKPIKSPG